MSVIQIKRGLDANRSGITPAIGELIWTTDTHKLYIGDGSTAGGISATGSVASDYILTTDKGSANGVATLDANSKIPTSQLPALALTEISVVTDETAQLALTAEEGDIAIRSDENLTYAHNGGTAGTMSDWTLLETPADAVTSINGSTGAVTLDTDDIDEGDTNLYFTTARLEALINDAATVATNETWSANKIQTEITALIDDTIVDTDNVTNKTLSADKIYEIAAAGGDSAVSGSINDAVVASDSLWSSSKTKEYADAKIDDNATAVTDKTWSINKIETELTNASKGWTGVSMTDGVLEFTSDDGLGFSTVDLRGSPGAKGDTGADGDDGASISRKPSADDYDASTGILTIGLQSYDPVSTNYTDVSVVSTTDIRGNTTDFINDTTPSSTTIYSSTKIDTKISEVIDDTTPSSTKAYSSTKVESQITALIDDTIVDTDNVTNKTLSADKIYSIAAAGGDSAVSGSINDTAVATDSLWSSSKTKEYADAIKFIDQTDTPAAYVADQRVVVNNAGDALIFVSDDIDAGTF